MRGLGGCSPAWSSRRTGEWSCPRSCAGAAERRLQGSWKAPIEGEANLTIFDGAGSGPYSTAEPWTPLPRERFSPLGAHDLSGFCRRIACCVLLYTLVGGEMLADVQRAIPEPPIETYRPWTTRNQG